MDILAVILATEKKSAELESLALKLISVSDCSFESWVALGYHYLLSRKLTRALYLAHKVCPFDELPIYVCIQLDFTIFITGVHLFYSSPRD